MNYCVVRLLALAVVIAGAGFSGCSAPEIPAPDVPSGPSQIMTGDTGEFCTSLSADHSQAASYRFDWGDGDTSDWSDFVANGGVWAARHVWSAAGKHELRAQVRLSETRLSCWSEACTISVRPAPGFPMWPSARMQFDFLLASSAISPDGQYLYVSGADTNLLAVVGTADNRVAAVIPGACRNYMVLSPDGQYLYSMAGYKVRTSDYTVVDSFGVGYSAYRIALSPDGAYLYITVPDCFIPRVEVIRTTDCEVVAEFGPPDYCMPADIATSRDGSVLYITLPDMSQVLVVRAVDFAYVTAIPTDFYPLDVAVSPADEIACVANLEGYSVSVFSTRDNGPLACVPVGDYEYFYDLYFTPDGSFVFVPSEDGVIHVVRMSDYAVVGNFEHLRAASVAFLPDGSKAYVVDGHEIIVLSD